MTAASSPSSPVSRAQVIGGGIAGLSAAFDLYRAGWQVAVYEASEVWGGKIQSSPVGGRMVDAGPDAFLARVDDAKDLCRELGMDHQLTSPVAPVPAYIYSRGALHCLPGKTYLGVPTDIDELADSSLISPEGIAPLTKETGLPRSTIDPDPSVGAICRERLGDEITARLIDPLVGGINASDIDQLSLSAATPQLRAAIETHGSLVTGLGAMLASASAASHTLGASKPQPVFYSLPGGVATMVDRLVAELADAELHLSSPVSELPSGENVIIAAPAFVAAQLLEDESPEAAAELATIGYASVSQVTVEYPLNAVHPNLDASGILFPRVDGSVMTACTWLSTKWAHYRKKDTVLLRMTSGRYGDDRANNLSDEDLTSTLLGELSQVIEIEGQPNAVRVQRWPKSFPQYEPGHRAKVERIRQAVERSCPSVTLVGAAYDGIGIPACIRSGRTAAKAMINR